jgi:hypothetical protein
VHRGHLLNRPYSSVDQPGPESRPVVTALLFDSLPNGFDLDSLHRMARLSRCAGAKSARPTRGRRR